MTIIERFSRRGLFLSASTVNVSALALFVLCAQLQPHWDVAKFGCVFAVCLHGCSYRWVQVLFDVVHKKGYG